VSVYSLAYGFADQINIALYISPLHQQLPRAEDPSHTPPSTFKASPVLTFLKTPLSKANHIATLSKGGRQGVVVCACNPSTWKTAVGGF
jgi:hypothetical protein